MSDVADWWRTSIIDMEPGRIEIRGHPLEELIGRLTFVEMIWLMIRGDTPGQPQARLLEAALVSAVDHGPQAPSIAAARMAVTCGLGLNGAMGTAVHMLDDVHGGAGEQLVALLHRIDEQGKYDTSSIAKLLEVEYMEPNRYVPGFGHRFHKPVDPRATRLMQLVEAAKAKEAVDGRFISIALRIESCLAELKGKSVPMNIDGATAVTFAELGFAPPLARGLFCLSRSVGAMAHGWEQMQQGGRNKGPTPPNYLWRYQPSDM